MGIVFWVCVRLLGDLIFSVFPPLQFFIFLNSFDLRRGCSGVGCECGPCCVAAVVDFAAQSALLLFAKGSENSPLVGVL